MLSLSKIITYNYNPHQWNRGSDSSLQTEVPVFDFLVRRRRAVAQIEFGRSYGSPYPLRYIKTHALSDVSHREGTGVWFPTTSGKLILLRVG